LRNFPTKMPFYWWISAQATSTKRFWVMVAI
jgi:hypothetical protein